MNRRKVLSVAATLGLSSVGISRAHSAVTSDTGSTALDTEVVETIDLPGDHARGMGHTRTDTDYLCVSFAPSEDSNSFDRGYYIKTDGSLDNSVVEGEDFSEPVTASGFDLSQSALYVTQSSGVLRSDFDTGEQITEEVSETPYSLTYDDDRNSLFVGLSNGLIFEMDESLDRVSTYDLSSSVFGLSHGAGSLWVGNQSSDLVRFDPDRREVVEQYDYPTVGDGFYDLAYFDGNIWLVGSETAYKTNIPRNTGEDTATPTETPSETPTETPSDTPEETPSGNALLCVENSSIREGGTRSVPVVITSFDSQGGFAGANIKIQFPTEVTPVGAEVNSELSPSSTSLTDQVVQFRASDGNNTFGQSTEQILLGTVTVRATNTGEGRVSIVEATVDDDDGQRVDLRMDSNCGRITTASGCPTVDGTETSDPDGDGLCEDLNGNGRMDFDDVNTYFDNFQSEDVRDNVSAFDFNNNGRIDFDDVNTLFDEVS